jgi:hypothetical protein
VIGVALFIWDFFFLAGRPVTALAPEAAAPAPSAAG